MAVNIEVHKVVVSIGENHFGFTTLSKAIVFVEEQYADQDYAKIYAEIEMGISTGAHEDTDLNIMDIDNYIDYFVQDDDTEE